METKNELNNFGKNDKTFLLFLLFIPCILIRRVLDNDTWFLLNSGRYVMEHGIPYIEPFLYMKTWILFAAMAYGCYLEHIL